MLNFVALEIKGFREMLNGTVIRTEIHRCRYTYRDKLFLFPSDGSLFTDKHEVCEL